MAIKKALVIYGGSIEELHAGDTLGGGDVAGPSASTDNAIARFDGTTGKLIQDSNVTVDDAGSIGGANSLKLDTTPTVATPVVGEVYWDEGNKTPSIQLENDVNLQLGQEIVTLCYNGTGSTIPNGSVVAVTGAQGQRPSIALADADSESTSARTLGITTQAIANGAEGFITSFGFVRGLDTSAITAGVAVYLSQTAGAFTSTKPAAPAHLVHLGYVIKSHASAGEIFVTINNGWEFDELHDVLITDLQSGQIPIRDQVLGVWKNITINGTTNEVTVTSTKDGITISLPDTIAASITGNAATVTNGLYTTDLGVTVQAYDADIPTVSASQVEMETGTESALRSMSPLRVAQAIAALGGGGGGFDAGTVMLFGQTAAPTGWTKSTAHDNKALRIVSGTASSGGSVDFTTALASQTPSGSIGGSFTVGATTLSTTQMPSHNHGPSTIHLNNQFGYSGVFGDSSGSSPYGAQFSVRGAVDSTGGGGSHTHSISGSPTFTGNAIDLAVKYVDVIMATKD